MSDRLVADALAAAVRAEGIDDIFLLTGGDQALWIALRDHGVRLLLARSERGAVYMADGHARVTGRPSLTYGQAGPGAANVAAALCDAWWAGSPVVAITSSVPIAARSGFPYQFLDQQGLFRPMTKWQAEADDPAGASSLLTCAVRTARSIPSGPVHLDLPKDLIRAPLPSGSGVPPVELADSPSEPDATMLDQFVAELSTAQRPVILAGAGVVHGSAWDSLRAFAELCQIPVATTPGGKGSFAEDHPLCIGVAGRYSRKVANELVERADVVLALGTRLGSLATVDGRIPSPSARVLQIDIDDAALGAVYRNTAGAKAEVGSALELMYEMAGNVNSDHSAWVAEVGTSVQRWRDSLDRDVMAHRGDGLHPAAVIQALSRHLNPADVLVADTGYMAAWASALYQVRAAGRTYLRAAGSLGWALPAALGASIGAPGRHVACLIGDGGVGYNLLELETAARLGIPALIVVLNNRSLAFEYHEQRHQWAGQVVEAANEFTDVDYSMVARELGAGGRRVTRMADLEPAIAEGLASERPWLLDVIVDKELIAPVTNFESVLQRVI
jgi:acetolactate synthase-1/2/3 large subunit